jgi:uncharacterized protein
MRVLFYALLLAVLYVAVKRWRTGPARQRRRPVRAVTRMVRCAQCGLHLPEGEAIREGQRFFCSPEHRRRALPPTA